MKLIGNSSDGKQIMFRARQKVTKSLNDRKIHRAINESLKEFIKRLNTVEKDSHEVGFFILQYAKLRMFELYYNFFDKFCDVTKLEELEMDSDSFYLHLLKKTYVNASNQKKKRHLEKLREIDCRDSFKAEANIKFFL